MNKLLKFLQKLEAHTIHYTIEHNRDEFIMVLVTIHGERWEVEFDEHGNIEMEVFKNSTSVYSEENMLDSLFDMEAK